MLSRHRRERRAGQAPRRPLLRCRQLGAASQLAFSFRESSRDEMLGTCREMNMLECASAMTDEFPSLGSIRATLAPLLHPPCMKLARPCALDSPTRFSRDERLAKPREVARGHRAGSSTADAQARERGDSNTLWKRQAVSSAPGRERELAHLPLQTRTSSGTRPRFPQVVRPKREWQELAHDISTGATTLSKPSRAEREANTPRPWSSRQACRACRRPRRRSPSWSASCPRRRTRG